MDVNDTVIHFPTFFKCSTLNITNRCVNLLIMRNIFEEIGEQDKRAVDEFLSIWHEFTESLYDNDRKLSAGVILNQARTAAEAIQNDEVKIQALDQVKEGEIALKQKGLF